MNICRHYILTFKRFHLGRKSINSTQFNIFDQDKIKNIVEITRQAQYVKCADEIFKKVLLMTIWSHLVFNTAVKEHKWTGKRQVNRSVGLANDHLLIICHPPHTFWLSALFSLYMITWTIWRFLCGNNIFTCLFSFHSLRLSATTWHYGKLMFLSR